MEFTYISEKFRLRRRIRIGKQGELPFIEIPGWNQREGIKSKINLILKPEYACFSKT